MRHITLYISAALKVTKVTKEPDDAMTTEPNDLFVS